LAYLEAGTELPRSPDRIQGWRESNLNAEVWGLDEMRRWVVVIPAILLVGLLAVLFFTRGTMEQLAFLRKGVGGEIGLVDQRPYQTAETLSGMAVSAEEQRLGQEALHLADHEVDQAFALALRQASMKQQKSLSGEAAALSAKMDGLKQTVKDDQAKMDALTATAKASGTASTAGDDLDVAKAQLQLDSDELADATGDLARATGDQRGQIEQELAAREAAMKKLDSGGAKKASAVAAVQQHATLWGRATAWFEQRSRAHLIEQAEAQATTDAKTIAADHERMDHEAAASGSQMQAMAGAGRVKMLQTMASERAMMSILDDRAQTQQQLAAVYGRWEQQVWLQHRILGHLVLESLAWVAFLVLATALAGVGGREVVGRIAVEPRQAHTLRTILTLALEVIGLIAVMLVVWGVPQQMPTILGLATAGLTVVFQDFILAFFGWFVLMGRNGIRVGDWVEINSVGGEVAEIGVFRTVLLETGNWTASGHPTGRRVTFTNSFAIRGQYFNFTTHGQWMWDEIKLNVPATADAYELIKKMQAAVEKETAKDTEQAEEEWRKSTSDAALREFSAKPTVDLRPATSGVDVIVRFVTRASDRFGLRNRIFEAMLGLMEGTERPAAEPKT
jgi:small-conductance mechanosensitive channel